MSATKYNKEVTDYVQSLGKKPGQAWQVGVCENLRKMVHGAIPGLEERLQYGKPHYLKNGHYAAVIHAGKGKVSFMIFNASDIAPVKDVLRAMGQGDRKVADISEGQEVDYSWLSGLLKETSGAL